MPGPEDVQIEEAQTRPQLIAAYVPDVDSDSHKYGPNSTEFRQTISRADDMLHHHFVGIEQRNLSDIVNIVVVSHHGMATTSTERLVQLNDLIDLDLIEHIDGRPLYGLRPKDPNDLRQLYDNLKAESLINTNFEVYLRDEDMPERYHFSKNDRIAPLWVIPKTGWAIVHKENFDINKANAKCTAYSPKGLHGYDHEHPLMRAIFIARGSAFPHKPNSRLETFQNLEVYNIICDSLGIEPNPNNGTLRLPLKPVGLHSHKHASPDDITADSPPEAEASITAEADDDSTVLYKIPAITEPANRTSPKENKVEGKDEGSSFYGKWKQMHTKVRVWRYSRSLTNFWKVPLRLGHIVMALPKLRAFAGRLPAPYALADSLEE